MMVEEALIAAEKLGKMGYQAAVENMFTIKPVGSGRRSFEVQKRQGRL
ncbi:MAG: hypothetical protein V8R80_00410 [Eubacterium sp.]